MNMTSARREDPDAVLVEALRHEAPRAMEQLVERYGCGVVVPFEDPEAAAKSLLELRTDEHRRREMGAAGRAAALRDLDWSRDGERFNETLSGWVSQRAPSPTQRRAAHGT